MYQDPMAHSGPVRQKTECSLKITPADWVVIVNLQMETWQIVQNGSLSRYVQYCIDALGIEAVFEVA
jgi:hypothetical protein